MKNILIFTGLILVIVLSGCNKCDPSNSVGGYIIKNSIVRVIGGTGGPQFITNANQYNVPIEMSLDGGVTYKPVDFDKYSVFALPTAATCSSGYNRTVTVSDASQTATYSITITECEYCEGTTNIRNWVLTSAVPENYTAIFDINKN